jgi:hypothetical protein
MVMNKTKIIFVLAVCCFAFLGSVSSVDAAARVLDTPDAKLLDYGAYEFEFRFFSQGNVLSNLNFGVLKVLNVGVSWETDKVLGSENIRLAIPALQAKLMLFEGAMYFPAFAIGYDGQGYFWNSGRSKNYLQECRGVYAVAGTEFLFENLMLNFGINTNDLEKIRLYGFINAKYPIYRRYISALAEVDNVRDSNSSRVNLGFSAVLASALSLDCFVRDCWGGKSDDGVPNERVIKIVYSGKF